MSLDTVHIYTDASFSNAHKIAVIGHFFLLGSEKIEVTQKSEIDFHLEQIKETTNIRAEIKSALLALKMAPKGLKVVLYTDCASICKLPSRRHKLENTNFISQSRFIPLNNADLYREFFEMMDSTHPEVIWVKGHSRDRARDPIQNNFAFLDQKVRNQLRKVVSEIAPKYRKKS